MDKAVFKYIESELYSYHQLAKEYKAIRSEILHQSEFNESPDENVGAGKSNVVISPIESTVTKLMMDKRLVALERTITAINLVYEECESKTQDLIRLTYWTKPQTLSKFGIAEQVGMSESTARRHKNKVIESIAEQLGLLAS